MEPISSSSSASLTFVVASSRRSPGATGRETRRGGAGPVPFMGAASASSGSWLVTVAPETCRTRAGPRSASTARPPRRARQLMPMPTRCWATLRSFHSRSERCASSKRRRSDPVRLRSSVFQLRPARETRWPANSLPAGVVPSATRKRSPRSAPVPRPSTTPTAAPRSTGSWLTMANWAVWRGALRRGLLPRRGDGRKDTGPRATLREDTRPRRARKPAARVG